MSWQGCIYDSVSFKENYLSGHPEPLERSCCCILQLACDKTWNVDSLYHPAIVIMSATDTPWAFADDVEADLVECALKMPVSMPAKARVSFIHLPTVAGDTGFTIDTSRGSGLSGDAAPLSSFILSSYCTRVLYRAKRFLFKFSKKNFPWWT